MPADCLPTVPATKSIVIPTEAVVRSATRGVEGSAVWRAAHVFQNGPSLHLSCKILPLYFPQFATLEIEQYIKRKKPPHRWLFPCPQNERGLLQRSGDQAAKSFGMTNEAISPLERRI
jgi:hypothetical protein